VLTRLPAAERERVEAAFDAGPFETGPGTIDKWVSVPIGADDLDDLAFAIRVSQGAELGESRTVRPPSDEHCGLPPTSSPQPLDSWEPMAKRKPARKTSSLPR